MNSYTLTTAELRAACGVLRAGDRVLLSGTVYTARDAAHQRICSKIAQAASLPFPLSDAVLYYAGPTPTPPGLAIGSCGPTTASRMDSFAPLLYDRGVCATIGKGPRNRAVREAVMRNGGVYLCAVGGAGALAAAHILSCRELAFADLLCESVKALEFGDFPLVVGLDCNGGNLFEKTK